MMNNNVKMIAVSEEDAVDQIQWELRSWVAEQKESERRRRYKLFIIYFYPEELL